MQIYFFFTDTMFSTRYFFDSVLWFSRSIYVLWSNFKFFFCFISVRLFTPFCANDNSKWLWTKWQWMSNAIVKCHVCVTTLGIFDESKRRAHKVRTWISNMNSVKRCNNKLISKDCLFIASHVPSFSSFFISHHRFVIFCDILSKTSKKFQWFELLSQIILLFKWID